MDKFLNGRNFDLKKFISGFISKKKKKKKLKEQE